MFLKPLINGNFVTVTTNQHRETHPCDINNLGPLPETTALYTSLIIQPICIFLLLVDEN